MEFDKSVLVLTHSDYLITDAGVEKVIQGQQKLFLKNKINFIVVYPLRKDINIFGWIHSTTLSDYGLIVNGKNLGTIQHDQLQEILKLDGLSAVIIHELVTFKKNEKLLEFFEIEKNYKYNHLRLCISFAIHKLRRWSPFPRRKRKARPAG